MEQLMEHEDAMKRKINFPEARTWRTEIAAANHVR